MSSSWHVRVGLAELHTDESGQDLIEYALLAALVALAVVAGLNFVAGNVNSAFSHVATKMHDHGKHLGWWK